MKDETAINSYELTLTPNYVSDWNFNDALRELIQNGTDQEVLDPDNEFQIDYSPKEKVLRLKNRKSVLKINTLLLGRSSKANNEDTVGQFGETENGCGHGHGKADRSAAACGSGLGQISDSRLNAGWRAANYSAEMTDRTSRDTIRARARDLERNSDIANSLISAYKRNVIGAGFNLQAKTKNTKLNADIEKLWKKWCKARNCDVTGTQTLNQILRMAVTRKKVDGGILFVKVYTNDGMIPFKLQMIEVDELDTLQVGETAGGNRIVGGIEYNKYNRPVAYWIRQYGIDGFSLEQPRRIDANDVIFYYTKRRPSQIREMSDMSQTATRIRDTNEFMTAVSVKERIAACLSVFIKKQLPTVGIGRNAATENVGKHEYDGKTLTPGMIKELNAGDEVQVVNPTGQGSDATSFTKLQQRMIGAGQGLSYEATSRDMSETNYASARQGAIEDCI